MKQHLKAIVPRFLLRAYHSVKRARQSRRNAKRTPEQVFSEIYRRGLWGKTSERFCSGSGSTTDSVVQPYVTAVLEYLRSYGPAKPKIVDLGCGDFSVGRHFVELCSQYVAVDVVPDVIRHLQASVTDPRLQFLCLDITTEEIPDGDICFIRQVLQHLSNVQILKVLPKLKQYKVVFITEHYPADGAPVVPNLDRVHGAGIRLYDNSGVYLDKPPFNMPSAGLGLFLEVPGHGFDELYHPGVIRTFKLVSAGSA